MHSFRGGGRKKWCGGWRSEENGKRALRCACIRRRHALREHGGCAEKGRSCGSARGLRRRDRACRRLDRPFDSVLRLQRRPCRLKGGCALEALRRKDGLGRCAPRCRCGVHPQGQMRCCIHHGEADRVADLEAGGDRQIDENLAWCHRSARSRRGGGCLSSRRIRWHGSGKVARRWKVGTPLRRRRRGWRRERRRGHRARLTLRRETGRGCFDRRHRRQATAAHRCRSLIDGRRGRGGRCDSARIYCRPRPGVRRALEQALQQGEANAAIAQRGNDGCLSAGACRKARQSLRAFGFKTRRRRGKRLDGFQRHRRPLASG